MVTHIEPQKQGLFIANVTADSHDCVFQPCLAQIHDTKKIFKVVVQLDKSRDPRSSARKF